jgi:hypothetical protein
VYLTHKVLWQDKKDKKSKKKDKKEKKKKEKKEKKRKRSSDDSSDSSSSSDDEVIFHVLAPANQGHYISSLTRTPAGLQEKEIQERASRNSGTYGWG